MHWLIGAMYASVACKLIDRYSSEGYLLVQVLNNNAVHGRKGAINCVVFPGSQCVLVH